MTIWLIILTLLIFHWSGCLTHVFPHIVMHIRRKTIEESRAYQYATELYKEPSWKIYLVSLHIGASNLIGSSFIEFDALGILDKICHVQDGEHFGESALVNPNQRRLESVIALEVCELLRLDRRDFKRLFALKSEFYDRLEKIARQREEKINSLNENLGDFQEQSPNASSLNEDTEKKKK
ncbi:hypothetical protein KM043_011947 [Ampulex compressa]|nr:hypothetical protein KM043_011947 [Ampulex compressa]